MTRVERTAAYADPRPELTFYLGTHHPHWLATAPYGVRLFVSHRRLAGRKTLPRASVPWALDSGGFTELSTFGEWRTTPWQYLMAIYRYEEEIGHLEWAAPQDWMCEPWITANTGLSVLEHQHRTVGNYALLRDLWDDDYGTCPIMPSLQGWDLDDYLRCIDLYARAGVDLRAQPVIGLGSVCRRQSTAEIGQIVRAVREALPGVRIHGFGVKSRGIEQYGHLLESADSLAWSYSARREPALPGCTAHQSCSNCPRYALRWRIRLLRAAARPAQLDLFDVAA